jgi:hypothetical protein
MQFTFKREAVVMALYLAGTTLLGSAAALLLPLLVR